MARFGGVGHGYWIALTVLMVLRPETAHTYTRCVGRVAAVAAGVVVASALTTLWHPTGLAAAALAVVFLGLTYAVVGFGFLALSAALAAALVFIIDIAATEAAGFDERLIATAIGGALAVVAHVVLPDDAMVRLRQRAGELLKTEIDYAATVINGFVHELDHPADKLSAAWQRAFRARAAFEAASGATRRGFARVEAMAAVVPECAERRHQFLYRPGNQPPRPSVRGTGSRIRHGGR